MTFATCQTVTFVTKQQKWFSVMYAGAQFDEKALQPRRGGLHHPGNIHGETASEANKKNMLGRK